MDRFELMLRTATRFVELEFCHVGHCEEVTQASAKPMLSPGTRLFVISRQNVHPKHATIIRPEEKCDELALF